MSNSYERMNFITSFGFSIIWRKQFIRKLKKSDQEIKVIDLMSGLGENWEYLTKHYPNANFVALDFADEMVEKSRRKNLRQLGNRFKILHQNILENKLKSQDFDIITCAFGLKTFNEEQLELLAKTVNRILKDEGEFSFIEISKPKAKILFFPYKFYLSKIIPILGKFFLGNPNDYRMLWLYTENFDNSQKVKEIFERNNLRVKYDSYFFGCATGISGKKIATNNNNL